MFSNFKLFFSSFSTTSVHLIRDHLWDCPKVVLKTTFGQSQRWSYYRNFTMIVLETTCAQNYVWIFGKGAQLQNYRLAGKEKYNTCALIFYKEPVLNFKTSAIMVHEFCNMTEKSVDLESTGNKIANKVRSQFKLILISYYIIIPKISLLHQRDKCWKNAKVKKRGTIHSKQVIYFSAPISIPNMEILD